MTLGIEPLPQAVVHLITAGEVIDSLAAVVRELAENALDAAATRITIALWLDQWRVRVVDNGIGMSLDDLKQAATAHSTSKIRVQSDLWNISSLGFRGEALHSLAQLSDLQIASRLALPHPDQMSEVDRSGWAMTCDRQGRVTQLEAVPIAAGTIVTADRIFANLPARRQALPAIAQQLRAVQTVIHHLALCHPGVTWQVQQDGHDWFTLFPGDTARQTLPQILRNVQHSDLEELSTSWQGEAAEARESANSPESRLYLLLGLPDRCHRHRSDWIRIAVNGRVVQLPELEQTVLVAFRRVLPRDRYPVCWVHLHVPPEEIDWNRHPAKSEIYLRQLDGWRGQVSRAIEQALRLNPQSLPENVHSQRVGSLLKTAEAAGRYSLSAGEDSPPVVTSPLKAIAQIHNMYILGEHPTGVWLIEQHIAHERVLYEQLSDRWHVVPLETPLILSNLAQSQVEQLQRLGIELEPFGEETWVARSAPEMVALRSDCAEALVELSLGGDLHTAQAAVACRSAIRNGTPLTLEQMQTLLNQWQQTRNPRTCPHGRPICLTLEESSLSRFFRRHWMIGKSHGI